MLTLRVPEQILLSKSATPQPSPDFKKLLVVSCPLAGSCYTAVYCWFNVKFDNLLVRL